MKRFLILANSRRYTRIFGCPVLTRSGLCDGAVILRRNLNARREPTPYCARALLPAGFRASFS
jgi:hypothetical protein